MMPECADWFPSEHALMTIVYDETGAWMRVSHIDNPPAGDWYAGDRIRLTVKPAGGEEYWFVMTASEARDMARALLYGAEHGDPGGVE